MMDTVEREKVLRCIKESRENIDWGQSEDGDAFLHYSAALYRTIASHECLPSVQSEIIRCGDCKYNNNCDIQFHAQAGDTFYCGAAKRRVNVFD